VVTQPGSVVADHRLAVRPACEAHVGAGRHGQSVEAGVVGTVFAFGVALGGRGERLGYEEWAGVGGEVLALA
jgi:hypothetical protein